jgi:hypothetical protein
MMVHVVMSVAMRSRAVMDASRGCRWRDVSMNVHRESYRANSSLELDVVRGNLDAMDALARSAARL